MIFGTRFIRGKRCFFRRESLNTNLIWNTQVDFVHSQSCDESFVVDGQLEAKTLHEFDGWSGSSSFICFKEKKCFTLHKTFGM
jgi:hypothetical protein